MQPDNYMFLDKCSVLDAFFSFSTFSLNFITSYDKIEFVNWLSISDVSKIIPFK